MTDVGNGLDVSLGGVSLFDKSSVLFEYCFVLRLMIASGERLYLRFLHLFCFRRTRSASWMADLVMRQEKMLRSIMSMIVAVRNPLGGFFGRFGSKILIAARYVEA